MKTITKIINKKKLQIVGLKLDNLVFNFYQNCWSFSANYNIKAENLTKLSSFTLEGFGPPGEIRAMQGGALVALGLVSPWGPTDCRC